jgi:NADPH-dependent 2,4-dienoyl-CoA reductase/sulfur reductase-like enzyme
MASPINTEVLIVGGGPVGLTLAMDLAQRGVGVTLAEMRAAGEPPSVRCNHVSAHDGDLPPARHRPRRPRCRVAR